MPKTDSDTFEKRVRTRLLSLRMSQSELARRMETTPQALRSILQSSNPQLDTLRRMAEALECEPGELIP